MTHFGGTATVRTKCTKRAAADVCAREGFHCNLYDSSPTGDTGSTFTPSLVPTNPTLLMIQPHLAERGPLLLTSGTDDHVVPLKVTQEVFDKYQHGSSDTELHVFEGKGHSLTIDGGWKDVADVVLDWLTKKGF